MIRRRVGDEFWIIAQEDHAHLSGRLARLWGNEVFAPPDPLEETLLAVSMHDCGWPLHDVDAPTLNKAGLPTDVFETPLPLAVRLWAAAVDRLNDAPPYSQLLVSIHVLNLSAFAGSRPHTRHELFDLNRFQHREIERQESLRKKLGLAVDRPVKWGLAVASSDPVEEQLKFNHSVLQVGDRLSLALCCTEPPFLAIENIAPRVGAARVTLNLARPAPTTLTVRPWPFREAAIEVSVPYRTLPARPWASEADFRAAYAGTEARQLVFDLRPE